MQPKYFFKQAKDLETLKDQSDKMDRTVFEEMQLNVLRLQRWSQYFHSRIYALDEGDKNLAFVQDKFYEYCNSVGDASKTLIKHVEELERTIKPIQYRSLKVPPEKK